MWHFLYTAETGGKQFFRMGFLERKREGGGLAQQFPVWVLLCIACTAFPSLTIETREIFTSSSALTDFLALQHVTEPSAALSLNIAKALALSWSQMLFWNTVESSEILQRPNCSDLVPTQSWDPKSHSSSNIKIIVTARWNLLPCRCFHTLLLLARCKNPMPSWRIWIWQGFGNGRFLPASSPGGAGTRYEATYLSWQAVFHRSRDQ